MAVKLPTCPVCKNEKKFFIIRQMNVMAEDTTQPLSVEHPGAGVTHPAFGTRQFIAAMTICRECGVAFWDLPESAR